MTEKEIVNLNRFRKARTRSEKKNQADANSVAFGRRKAEKTRDKLTADKAAQDLDAHRRDD